MHYASMSATAIAKDIGYHPSTISKLVRKHQKTNEFTDRQRSVPWATRENAGRLRITRYQPFTIVCVTEHSGKVKSVGYRSRRHIRRLHAVTKQHDWPGVKHDVIGIWRHDRKIHWWDTAYDQRNNMETVPFGGVGVGGNGGSLMVWGYM